jgi:hypothetical protein
MEENNSKERKFIKSLTPRLYELSGVNESVQNNDDPINQIIGEINISYKNFCKYYNAIENSKLIELKKSFYKNAVRYAKLRADWFLVDREQRELMHEERRSAHNVFIDACNIISRSMIKNGEDASWRKELGDDRKVIGDFACYLSFVLGIKAR